MKALCMLAALISFTLSASTAIATPPDGYIHTINGCSEPADSPSDHTRCSEHQTFLFMGDTYVDLCAPESILTIDDSFPAESFAGHFLFMGDQFMSLPTENLLIEREIRKTPSFFFMGEQFTDLPAEGLIIPRLLI